MVQGPAPSLLLLTEADAGRSLELKAGGRIEVTLQGNPATGFEWTVGGGDAAIVKLLGSPEIGPSDNTPGAPGRVTLRFAAVAAGKTKLRLIYHRPFETDKPPERTFEVTLTVR